MVKYSIPGSPAKNTIYSTYKINKSDSNPSDFVLCISSIGECLLSSDSRAYEEVLKGGKIINKLQEFLIKLLDIFHP